MFDNTKLSFLPQMYAWGGPIATPLVSAIKIGHHVYTSFGDPWLLAVVSGVGAFLGFEACGGACVATAIRLHSVKRHDTDFWVCLAGVGAYMIAPGLIINTDYSVLVFAVLAVFAVFAGNTYFSLEREAKEKDAHRRLSIEERKTETQQINAKTKLVLAEQQRVRPNEQPNTAEQGSVRERIYAILAEQPKLGPREVSRMVGCAPSTASGWIKKWKQENEAL